VGWWFHVAQIYTTSELRTRNDGYPTKRNIHQNGSHGVACFMHGGSLQFSFSVAFGHAIDIS